MSLCVSDIKSGDKFGNWEVLSYHHKDKSNRKYFLCKCRICGKIKPVRGSNLLNGTSSSCSKGCTIVSNLIGKSFGDLTVLKLDSSQKNFVWCRCSCGKEKSIRIFNLTHDMTKSCGCKSEQFFKETFNRKAEEELIGRKFGKLTVISQYKKENDTRRAICNCDCGSKNVIVSVASLKAGTTSSCGCLNSKANMLMDSFLTKLKINFKREVRFEDCKDRYPLPFDFAIYNSLNELLGLIELNGKQHYSSIGTWWNTPERLTYQQKHDYIKMKFCEDNHIPFLIIPYQYFNELEKFVLTSDFWEIITKNLND